MSLAFHMTHQSLDIWSVGCTLYKLYMGKKMIKKAKFGDSYFDEMGSFDSIKRDRVTGAVSGL
jgi:serine/threonine-protein kinase PRP4